jgi:uncharacterized protein (TIGR04255 family)
MNQPSTPSYRKPPVSEVAVGLQFERLPIQTRHLGQFWTEVAGSYPQTEDVAPLPEPGEVPGIEYVVVPPLRRTFLISNDGEFLLQIQDNRFYCNWRKLSPDVFYPRFPAVYDRFVESWGLFSDFLKRQGFAEISPTGYELTYVNEIEVSRESVAQDVAKCVRMYVPLQKPEFLPEPASISGLWLYNLPDSKGKLRANLNHLRKPDGRESFVLNLSCSGTVSPKTSMADWFETAHEWIVRGFTDLTTPEAHQKWEREK